MSSLSSWSSSQKSCIRESDDGSARLFFAHYHDSTYRTNIKYYLDSNNNKRLVYCINHTKYSPNKDGFNNSNNIFSNACMAKLSYAYAHGCHEFGKKADAAYTTGDWVKDYFMTQAVIHGLIGKYGGSKSEYGINFADITYETAMSSIKSKADLLYKDASKWTDSSNQGLGTLADGYLSSGYSELLLQDDIKKGAIFRTTPIALKTTKNTGEVLSCKYSISNSDIEDLALDEYQSNRSFELSVPRVSVDELKPGVYRASVKADTSYKLVKGACKVPASDSTLQELYLDGVSTMSNALDAQVDLVIGAVHVKKIDEKTKSPLEGAKFVLKSFSVETNDYEDFEELIYDDEQEIYYSSNLYKTTDNPNGLYKVCETLNPESYKGLYESEPFVISKDNYVIDLVAENTPNHGSIQINKLGLAIDHYDTEKGIISIDKEIEGVIYELYAAEDIYVPSSKRIQYRKDEKVAELITDKNGFAIINNLPYGTYNLIETYAPDIYIKDEKINTIQITKEDKDQSLSFYNNRKDVEIKIHKIDGDTNENLSGVLFGVYAMEDFYNIDGEKIINKNDLIAKTLTDDKGYAEFHLLPDISYEVMEISTLNGYLDEQYKYDLNKDKYLKENANYKESIEVKNYQRKGVLDIIKKGFNYNANPVKETNKVNRTIEGAKFSIYDMKDNIVDTIITDKTGHARSKPLLPGKYYFVEREVPFPYKVNDKKINFEISNEEKILDNEYQTIDEQQKNNDIIMEHTYRLNEDLNIYENSFQIYNDIYPSEIVFSKLNEIVINNNNKVTITSKPTNEAEFALYFNNKGKNDQTIDEDEKWLKIENIKPDIDGRVVIKEKLTEGEYIIREIAADENHSLSDDLIIFNVDYADENLTLNNGYIQIKCNRDKIINRLKKGSILVIKKDGLDNKPLKNATIGLYLKNGTLYQSRVTDEKGEALFNDIPIGNYVIREIKAPDNYVLSVRQFKVNVKEDKESRLSIMNYKGMKLGFVTDYFIQGSMILFILLYAIRQRKELKSRL